MDCINIYIISDCYHAEDLVLAPDLLGGLAGLEACPDAGDLVVDSDADRRVALVHDPDRVGVESLDPNIFESINHLEKKKEKTLDPIPFPTDSI